MSAPSLFNTQSGIFWDRQWMFVKEETGKFISQRELPQLALLESRLPEELLLQYPADPASKGMLTIFAPGLEPLQVPVAFPQKPEFRNVIVWEWKGVAHDEGAEAAAWASKALGFPARLVRYLGSATGYQRGTDMLRTANPDWAANFEVRFHDGYPLLMATEASLADLNTRLPQPVSMDRFRPNIILDGLEPWEEDTWATIRVVPAQTGGDAVEFTLCKPCDRCKVPTNDPTTGVMDPDEQPLSTLQDFRSGKTLGWNKEVKTFTYAAFFAWNMCSLQDGIISVGDQVEVTSKRDKLKLGTSRD